MAQSIDESTVEEAAISWFHELGYATAHGPDIAHGEPATERDAFSNVVLFGRLREAIDRLNAGIPHEARDEAFRKVLLPDSSSLVGNNRKLHKTLRDGVKVEYCREDGSIEGYDVRLIDFDDVEGNDWLTANKEWLKVWRSIEGDGDAPTSLLELEVLVRGVFERERLLKLLQHFVVFEEDTDNRLPATGGTQTRPSGPCRTSRTSCGTGAED